MFKVGDIVLAKGDNIYTHDGDEIYTVKKGQEYLVLEPERIVTIRGERYPVITIRSERGSQVFGTAWFVKSNLINKAWLKCSV